MTSIYFVPVFLPCLSQKLAFFALPFRPAADLLWPLPVKLLRFFNFYQPQTPPKLGGLGHTDEILGFRSSKNNGKKLSLKILRRLKKIESLPLPHQKTILKTIDTFMKGAEK